MRKVRETSLWLVPRNEERWYAWTTVSSSDKADQQEQLRLAEFGAFKLCKIKLAAKLMRQSLVSFLMLLLLERNTRLGEVIFYNSQMEFQAIL